MAAAAILAVALTNGNARADPAVSSSPPAGVDGPSSRSSVFPAGPTEPPSPAIWSVPVWHSVGVLAGMRLSLSLLWPDAYDPRPLSRTSASFGRAYRDAPEWRRGRAFVEADGDPWTINVLGHGLFGAEIYGRTRSCGGSPLQAFVFAAGTSAVWEYGIESWNKRPSGIDLLLTPILGAAFGEARVQTQRWLRGRPRGGWRRVLELVIDPLGEGERIVLRTRC